MTNSITDISLRQAAIVAGFGYLLIFIIATIANFFLGGLKHDIARYSQI